MYVFIGKKIMIKGIGGRPFISLDPFIDVEGFVKLHGEISKGIVLSKHKKEGNLIKPTGILEPGAWTADFKPTFMAWEEYQKLPYDDPIRVAGRELGEMDNRDQFIQYLKLTMGAYDAYQFVFLKTEAGGWDTRAEEKAWTEDSLLFPNFRKWLDALIEQKVFKHLGRIIIFKQEHDCLPPCHRDAYETDLGVNRYEDHRTEFIHITPNDEKKLFLWDPETDQKVYAPSRACWFNDLDWHGAERNIKQAYGVRIDGVFTDEFRKLVGVDHLTAY